MRYELFLNRLPKLDPRALEEQLGELPEGLSAGVLKKALETSRLPTIAVGWGESRADMKQIAARIAELGGHCQLKDHASFVVRAWTALDEAWSALLTSVGLKSPEHTRKPTRRVAGIPLVGHAGGKVGGTTAFLIELVVGLLLYGGYTLMLGKSVAPDVMLVRVGIAALGICCAHVLKLGVTASLEQRIGLLAAAPTVVIPLSALMFAVLNLNAAPAPPQAPPKPPKAAAEEAPLPPPVLHPYQGLVEELRIRKLKALERALQDLRGGTALPEGAGLSSARAAVDPAHARTQTTQPTAGERAPAPPSGLHDPRLLIAALSLCFGLLAALGGWLRVSTRRARGEARELEQRHQARISAALQQIEALQRKLQEEGSARETLQRSLAEQSAARESAERVLKEQHSQHSAARAALERELSALRAEHDRALAANATQSPRTPARGAPRMEPAAAFDPRGGLPMDTAAAFEPRTVQQRRLRDDSPLPAALMQASEMPPKPAPAAPHVAPAAPAAPARHSAPGPQPARTIGQRSSYAVHDVDEERIAMPKTDKR